MRANIGDTDCVSVTPDGVITGLKPGTIGFKGTGYVLRKSGGVDRVYVKVVDRYEEEEPNNDFPYATSIRSGYPMDFYLSSTSDIDVFKFDNPRGQANDQFDITFDYAGDGGGSASRVMRWELYNSSYQLFGSGTLSFTGDGGSYTIPKWFNTSIGYLKFYFPSDFISYPQMRPTGKLTVTIGE